MKTNSETQYIVPFVKDDILYDLLRAEDVIDASDCIAETFSSGEPMTRILEITKDEFLVFSKIICEKTVGHGLSIVAKDRQTGKLCGSLVNEDFVTDSPEGLDKISTKLKPIFTMLERLDDKYKERHSVSRNEILHIFMSGVYKKYIGRQISGIMKQAGHNIARMKKYKGAISEATGPFSQKINRGLGYKLIDSINYKEFEFEGC